MKKNSLLFVFACLLTLTTNAQNCFVWIDSYTDATCPNSCDGSATAGAAVQPNTFPQFLWTPGNMTTATINNLCPGVYTITLTTTNCQATDYVTIGSGGVSITSSSVNASCSTCATGSATANVTGGNGPYIYSWAPGGQTTATATGLLPGNYTVYVTDNSGCGTVQHPVTVGSNNSTGIYAFNAEKGFSINPMPITESANIHISSDGFGFPYTIKVFDVTGKEVSVIENINQADYTFSKGSIYSGVYFLTATSSNGRIAQGKIIIQ